MRNNSLRETEMQGKLPSKCDVVGKATKRKSPS